MKIRIHLFLCMLCVLLLSSCATATAVMTPTATITQAAALVALSPIPPTATLEPSPTVGPRFGPPPTAEAGFTLGTDMTLLRYTETDASGNARYWSPEIGTWTESQMEDGPINLTSVGGSIYEDFTLNFSSFVVPKFDFSSAVRHLIQTPGESDFQAKNMSDASLASTIIVDTFNKVNNFDNQSIQKHYDFSSAEGRQKYFNDVNKMIEGLKAGKLTDINGKSADLTLNGSSVDLRKGSVEIWINPEDAKNDPDMHLANGLYMKIMVVNKQLVAIMSPSSLDAMQDSKFRREMLAPLQAFLEGPSSLPRKITWIDYQDYGAVTDKGVSVRGVSVDHETITLEP